MTPFSNMIIASESTPAQQIANRMLEHQISCMVIVADVAQQPTLSPSSTQGTLINTPHTPHSYLNYAASGTTFRTETSQIRPIGLITSSDIVKCYAQVFAKPKQESSGLESSGTLHSQNESLSPLTSIRAKDIMSVNFIRVEENATRDFVAEVLMREKKHHAFIVDNETGNIKGIVSSFDVVREVALDAKAWPWYREAFNPAI